MRLIDADALMREFAEFVRPSNNSDFADVPTWNDAVSLVDSAPTIDPVKHGKWDKNKIAFHWKCSECGVAVFNNLGVVFDYTGKENMNYCPNCGAKMEENE